MFPELLSFPNCYLSRTAIFPELLSFPNCPGKEKRTQGFSNCPGKEKRLQEGVSSMFPELHLGYLGAFCYRILVLVVALAKEAQVVLRRLLTGNAFFGSSLSSAEGD